MSGLAILTLAGCGKAPALAPLPLPEAKPPTPKAELVKGADLSAHFVAVNQQLELGGTFYAYADIDGDVKKFGESLNQLGAKAAEANPYAAMAKQDYPALLNLLGIDAVKAIGASSVAIDGGYRNRCFIYMPEGRRGIFAFGGGEAKPFSRVKMAPADADFYTEAEYDLPALYEALKAVVGKVAGDAMINLLEAQLKQQKPKEPMPFELIQSMRGSYALALRLDPQQSIVVPGKVAFKLPGVNALLRIDGIGAPLAEAFENEKKMVKTMEGGLAVYEVASAFPGTKIQPAFAVVDGALWVATDKAFLLESIGRTSGLDQQPEFKQELAALGPNGNALTYVTPQFFAKVKQALAEIPGDGSKEAEMVLSFVRSFVPELSRPMVSVSQNLPNGVLVRSHWKNSHVASMFTAAMANPFTIGMISSLTIPAFEKVRKTSQEKTIQNNLRQIGAAAQQHMLEHEVKSVTFKELVKSEQFFQADDFKSVAGEDYSKLVIRASDHEISVRTSDGRVISARM